MSKEEEKLKEDDEDKERATIEGTSWTMSSMH
jgi:hypothetical protein